MHFSSLEKKKSHLAIFDFFFFSHRLTNAGDWHRNPCKGFVSPRPLLCQSWTLVKTSSYFDRFPTDQKAFGLLPVHPNQQGSFFQMQRLQLFLYCFTMKKPEQHVRSPPLFAVAYHQQCECVVNEELVHCKALCVPKKQRVNHGMNLIAPPTGSWMCMYLGLVRGTEAASE